MKLTLCDGTDYELPMFDPVVATHVQASHSLVGTLIDQINKEKIYAPFFEGKKNLTFLDIGANIGLVSVYASPACNRIVVVEPAPDTFKVLEAMALNFPVVGTVDLVPAALAPSDGTIEFHINDINSTASSTVNTYGTLTKVNGLTLSSILRIYQLEHVDVCKVDAEGGEGDSLTLRELATAASVIDSYYIETHNCPKSSWNDKQDRLITNLVKCGYKNVTIQGMAVIASK